MLNEAKIGRKKKHIKILLNSTTNAENANTEEAGEHKISENLKSIM